MALNQLESSNNVEEIFNFWLPKLDKLNFPAQKNKSLMAFVAIMCINPQNQNEKVKTHFNYIINGLLALAKQCKVKSVEKNQKENENEQDDIDDDEVENKFNVEKSIKNFLYYFCKIYKIFM